MKGMSKDFDNVLAHGPSSLIKFGGVKEEW